MNSTQLSAVGRFPLDIRRATLSLTLGLALALGGCSDSTEDGRGADVENVSEGALANAAETFHYLTQAEAEARFTKFVERNPGWGELEGLPPSSGDAITVGNGLVHSVSGAIKSAHRNHPYGPEQHISGVESYNRAMEFLQRNADLLGIPPEDLARLQLKEQGLRGLSYNKWFVRLGADYPCPGYEGFRGLQRHRIVEVTFESDGLVAGFTNWGDPLPVPSMSHVPKYQWGDPVFAQNLVGRPFISALDATDTGIDRFIRQEDLAPENARLDFFFNWGEDQLNVWLVYELSIVRYYDTNDGRHMKETNYLEVNANDGKLISRLSLADTKQVGQ